ncbi:aldo/keto reductase [Aquimarina sp. TRL1]|uniref:aldo/keto reductase n=1 Tax=Aquimarina sp. (strain TRL1) TaxID=2736252 RepID=UPI00158BA3AA|nr:aldo/keto reductase [Aquimarina sp. TRL1]QKX06948.1 aldo/keto reductase [Aquimarina sp. TRL1]
MEIGLGTAALGRPEYINIRQEEKEHLTLGHLKKNAFSVLDAAYKEGIRYFDTAPGYGMAEQLLIDWLQEKNDPGIEVATKWGYTYTANFDPNALIHEVKEHSLNKLNEQWNKSKELFPFLSVYQIHSATFESQVLENKEILNRLAMLKKEHDIRIGLTTTGENQVAVITQALAIEVNGIPLFDVFQSTYNILDQSIGTIAKTLERENKQLVIKEALANGRLFPNNKYTAYQDLYKKLESIALNYKVGIDAVAIQFCMQMLTPYKVLSGASMKKHVSQNLMAETFNLTDEEIHTLLEAKVSPQFYWKERKNMKWN